VILSIVEVSESLYFCLGTAAPYTHQGVDARLTLSSFDKEEATELIPLSVSVSWCITGRGTRKAG
jgi:hypothetical protein